MKIFLERKFSLVLVCAQLFLSISAIGILAYMDILSSAYFIMVIVLAVFLLAYTTLSQMTDKSKLIGQILSGLFSLLFACLSFYGFQNYKESSENLNIGKDNPVSYLVLKGNKVQNLSEAGEYTFGILKDIDFENTEKAIEYVNDKLSSDIKTTEFRDMDALIEGLYSETVEVILFNEAFRESVMKNHAMFEDDMRALYVSEG